MRHPRRLLLNTAVLLAIACSPWSSNELLAEDPIVDEYSGTAYSSEACLHSFSNHLMHMIQDLRFRDVCRRTPEGFVYTYRHVKKGERRSKPLEKTLIECADRLATALNKDYPGLDIDLHHRCMKERKIKKHPGKIYMWMYKYIDPLKQKR